MNHGLPAVLEAIFQSGTVIDADGKPRPADAVVTRDFSHALGEFIRRERPQVVLEIGMAYGVTSVAIAAALRENGSGRLITIDPGQSSHWGNIGMLNLERAGVDDLVTLIEEPDFAALPRLLAEETAVDLAYIDGLHSLEYAFLDFFYVDRMLRVGGVVGFNDCDWPAVLPTLNFTEKYRDYRRIDSGLKPVWGTYNSVAGLAQRSADAASRRLKKEWRASESRLLGPLTGRRRDDRYYRKISTTEPPEGFYAAIG